MRTELTRALALTACVLGVCACSDTQPGRVASMSANGSEPFAQVSSDMLNVTVNAEPEFLQQGRWSRGYMLAFKGGGQGVVVGPGGENQNVFAQDFDVTPGEPFRLETRAVSAGMGPAGGRFQINWVDANGQFLAVSSSAFKVGQEIQRFEFSVVAPKGAAKGILYVVADGHDSVVRYHEMRLLGGRWRQPVVPVVAHADIRPEQKPALDGDAFPRPDNLTPLDASGTRLTIQESRYYFYRAAKAMQRKARERGMDFILYVMPDENFQRMMPVIEQLRAEGVKVLAYAPTPNWPSGVDPNWYWQKADSHWTEAAVRLTADELLAMWKTQAVSNRPLSQELMSRYGGAQPSRSAINDSTISQRMQHAR